MPDSPLAELGPMSLAYAILAGLALCVAVVLKSPQSRRLPRYTTLEAVGLALFAVALPAIAMVFVQSAHIYESSQAPVQPVSYQVAPGTERIGVAYALALVNWIAILAVLGHVKYQPVDVKRGLLAFIALTPVVFGVYAIVLGLGVFFGEPPDVHPLSISDVGTPAKAIFFAISACLGAPILEESAFRGLLLPWARERRWRPIAIVTLALVILLSAKDWDHRGTMLFAVDLVAAMVLALFGREIWKKWPNRSASAIVSTAALFAALHAAVWPTPVPLFALGVGLGMLTVRTGSAVPAMIAHALFNSVSTLFLLSRSSL